MNSSGEAVAGIPLKYYIFYPRNPLYIFATAQDIGKN